MNPDSFIVFAPDVPEGEGRYPAPFDKEHLETYRRLGLPHPRQAADEVEGEPAEHRAVRGRIGCEAKADAVRSASVPRDDAYAVASPWG
jgi:hypothetical protein